MSVLNFFISSKVEYIFNLFNSLHYRQKILVSNRFIFLSVKYKLRSFNANEFKFVSY